MTRTSIRVTLASFDRALTHPRILDIPSDLQCGDKDRLMAGDYSYQKKTGRQRDK
jgi:hypothetical protein